MYFGNYRTTLNHGFDRHALRNTGSSSIYHSVRARRQQANASRIIVTGQRKQVGQFSSLLHHLPACSFVVHRLEFPVFYGKRKLITVLKRARLVFHNISVTKVAKIIITTIITVTKLRYDRVVTICGIHSQRCSIPRVKNHPNPQIC